MAARGRGGGVTPAGAGALHFRPRTGTTRAKGRRGSAPPSLPFVTAKGTLYLGRIRRGGFLFVTWIGDHAPRHVHVFRDGRLVLKWDLDRALPMEGAASRRLVKLLNRLEREGKL